MTDPFPTDPREAAELYLARGWMPIPLDGWRTKEVTRPGWPSERYAAGDGHRFAETNVGLLLGGPSGGLVDVDLDTAEAVRCAPEYLPVTGLVSGRAGAPRSHWWYTCDPLPAKSLKFLDPAGRPGDGEKATFVELRVGEGNAKMTVVPPSLHKDTGERIGWHRFDGPATVPAADLETAVRYVAAASLFARHWPDGVRHDSSLALAGGLLRAWDGDAERAERFVTAVCRAAGVDNAGLRKCQANVHDTAEKLQAGDKTVTGWPKLAGYVGDAVVTEVRALLGIRDTPKATFGRGGGSEGSGGRKGRVPRVVPEWVPFPVHLLPPVLARYVDAAARSYMCDPTFAALPLITAVGAAIGTTHRARIKKDWLEPPTFWMVGINPSGSVKSPPYLAVEDICQDINDRLQREYDEEAARYEAAFTEWEGAGEPAGEEPDEPVLRDFIKSDATIEALVGVLEDNPRGIVVGRDELSGWIGSFVRYARNGSSDLPHWLQLYNAGTLDYLRKTGDRRRVRVRGVAVCVMGTTQPAIIAEAMTPELRKAGLLARLIAAYPPTRLRRWSEDEIPDDIRGAVVGLIETFFAFRHDAWDDGRPRPRLVPLTADAKAMFVAFFTRNSEAMYDAPSDDERARRAKLEAVAARLALVFHCCRYPDGPDQHPIGVPDMANAVALTEWFIHESERVYLLLGENPEEMELRRLAEGVARKARRLPGFRITVKQLQNSNSRRYATAAAAEADLELLVGAGFGCWERDEKTGGGHNPKYYKPADRSVRPSDPSDPCPSDRDGDGEVVSDPSSDACVSGIRGESGPANPTHSGEKTCGDDHSCPSEQGSEGSDGRTGRVTEERVKNDPSPENRESEAGSEFPFGFNASPGSPDGPEPDAPPAPEPPSCGENVAFTVIDGTADLTPVIEAVRASERVGFDTETTGLNPRTGRVRLIQLATARDVFVVDCQTSMPTALLEALAGVELVGHNLAFDLGFLTRHRFVPGRLFDVMLASQVLDAGDMKATHGLAPVCQRHLGEVVGKDEQKSDWSGKLTPAQLQYAARDAELPLRLYPVLVAKLAEAKLTATADLENRALPCVAWMGTSGVKVDRREWQLRALAAQGEVRRLAAELDAMAPTQPGLFGSEPRNWNSPAQVKEAFAAVGIVLEATNDDALAAIDHPLAELLRRHRGASKLHGTYGDKWLRHVAGDDRVYPGWHQAFTVTGRMSSSGPNMQQLPRDSRYRKCFVAPPGRALVKADYSQIELRIAAVVAGDSTMMGTYRDGGDIHALTAASVLGKPLAEVTKTDRQLAKAVNFGLLFGGGAAMLVGYAKSSYGVTMTEAQAQKYRAAFFARYHGLKRWHNAQSKAPVATRTRGGRRRKNVESFTEKLNSVVQGTAADGMKAALALLWERRAEHPTAFPVLAVHDEIVVECDAADAGAVTAWLTRAMTDGMTPFCDPVPVEVEATIAPTWGG